MNGQCEIKVISKSKESSHHYQGGMKQPLTSEEDGSEPFPRSRLERLVSFQYHHDKPDNGALRNGGDDRCASLLVDNVLHNNNIDNADAHSSSPSLLQAESALVAAATAAPSSLAAVRPEEAAVELLHRCLAQGGP